MNEVGQSIIKGSKKALQWKQSIDTGARVHYYSETDIANIKDAQKNKL